MEDVNALLEEADRFITRTLMRLEAQRAHAESVSISGGDIEEAMAVVRKTENTLRVLKAYRDIVASRGGLEPPDG